MRIMQLLPELNSGGVERGTLEVADALVRLGHDSLVVSNGGRLVKPLEVQGSMHFQLPIHKKSPLSLLQIPALRALILKTQPDIVHVRSRVPAWLTWLALKTIPIKQRPILVSTVHGFYSVNRYSAIMVAAQQIIAVSDSVVDYIKQFYPYVPPHKITRIFRGIDPSEFPHGYQPSSAWWQETYKLFPQIENKKIICLPGRITRLKGHESLIQLMQQLKNDVPDTIGVIVGGADIKKQAYLEELTRAIKKANLEDHVIFTGHQSDIRNWLSVSNIVLSLSNKPETFGRTSLEALSLGKPVVGWAHGGVKEVLQQLYPVGLVNPFDEVTLLTTVKNLLIQPIIPRQIDRFLKSQMTNETIQLYQKTIAAAQ